MSQETGFYSIATDGSSLFVSNTSRNSICKIGPDGEVDNNFIIVTSPISIAIRTNVLFVQTLRLIHVYNLSVSYQATNIASLRFDSSGKYPSMAYNRYDNLLYISNYERGTITTMSSTGVFTRVLSNLYGISGLSFASNVLYFSNEVNNTISFYTNNITQECLSITRPKGISFSPNGLYICYGTTDNFGIALHKLSSSVYTDVMNTYLERSLPLTITFAGGDFYHTADRRTEIYKNDERFIAVEYTDIKTPMAITQSVVTKNPNCINNPAFTALINLRTIGSNPNNPIIPVTTLEGRTQGAQVKIDEGVGLSYEVLKMRRKAEILKYKNLDSISGGTLTKKQSLSNLVNQGGSYQYSKAKIERLIREQNCIVGLNVGIPAEKTAPTKSGIVDPKFEGYYLNTNVPFYKSL